MNWRGGKFGFFCLVFQVIFIALFGIFVEYDESANAAKIVNNRDQDKGGQDVDNNDVAKYYPSEYILDLKLSKLSFCNNEYQERIQESP